MDRLQWYYSRNSRKDGGTKEVWRAQKKSTTWWNEETRQATKFKRKLYKKWLKDPTPQNKEQYQSARDAACKQVIKQAKEKTWSQYDNQLEDMPKTEAMKSFYKKVKNMRERDQPYSPITTIKDAQGQIITYKHQIKQRWGCYFEGLLNPNEDMRYNKFSAQDILEHEREIQRSEKLRSHWKQTGKAPGIDGISVEIIKAAGDHKGGIHHNSTLPEWKPDPYQQKRHMLTTTEMRCLRKAAGERPEWTRSETKKLCGE